MSLFDTAISAAENPDQFAAVFSQPGIHANLINPVNNYTLIVHLIIYIQYENHLIALLKVLVQHGVDLSYEVANMSIPLGTAALNDRIKAYHFLLLHTDKTLINRPLQTPVIIAAAGNLEILKDLIEVQGADIDISDSAGNTALSLANLYMRREVMDYLLHKKANIWLGIHLPLITAFINLRGMAFSLNVKEQGLINHKMHLDKLIKATNDYFYHYALAYQGTEEYLSVKFLVWRNYIESRIEDPAGSVGATVKLRALLEEKVFNPIINRLRQEKSLRFYTCMHFHRLANGITEQNKIAKTDALFDRKVIQETISYISKTPKHLSLPDKWLLYAYDALVKVNMGLELEDVWYSLDYKKFALKAFSSYDEKYSQGFANPRYWEMSAPYCLKIKEDVLPSVALASFFKGLTIADCGSVLVACQYAALLKILGARKFNKLFAAEAVPMTITQSIFDPVNPLAYFFIRSGAEVKVGDMCYFSSLKYYSKKHPLGHARGWSVLCTGKNALGENLYCGFGRDEFKVSSMSERALNQAMISIYNLPRDSFNQEWIRKQATQDEYDLRDIPLTVSYTEALSALEGYQPDSTISPDFNKIANYMLKEVVTVDEFIADYDMFLKEQNYPSFDSRPSSVLIELPLSLDDMDEKKDSPTGSPRIGIPMMRY